MEYTIFCTYCPNNASRELLRKYLHLFPPALCLGKSRFNLENIIFNNTYTFYKTRETGETFGVYFMVVRPIDGKLSLHKLVELAHDKRDGGGLSQVLGKTNTTSRSVHAAGTVD